MEVCTDTKIIQSGGATEGQTNIAILSHAASMAKNVCITVLVLMFFCVSWFIYLFVPSFSDIIFDILIFPSYH